MTKKIRIIWICYFSNSVIRERLDLSKKRKYFDFTPWISNMIIGFEKREDVELHIVSPHSGMKRQFQEFQKNSINYNFYKSDVPIIHHHWPFFFPIDKWTRFIKQRIIVYFKVKRIKPDVVILIGAENARSSSTVLWLKKFKNPVYVLIQGIISDPSLYLAGKKQDKVKIKIERKIHKYFKYFGIGAPHFCDLINRDNSSPIYLKAQAPRKINLSSCGENLKPKYDFVFFGRVDPNKGIEDLFEALFLVKKEKNDVSLNVIGSSVKSYLLDLKGKAKKLGIADNIKFSGHLPTLDDVHKEALKARFYVLPTKVEGMASSIIESMMLGLPVVTCRTGGLPFLNKNGQSVLMSEPGDVQGLASNMIKLLKSPELANELSIKAKEFALNEFSIEKITDTYMKQFKAIYENYHNGIPIPEELLFDENDFKH